MSYSTSVNSNSIMFHMSYSSSVNSNSIMFHMSYSPSVNSSCSLYYQPIIGTGAHIIIRWTYKIRHHPQSKTALPQTYPLYNICISYRNIHGRVGGVCHPVIIRETRRLVTEKKLKLNLLR